MYLKYENQYLNFFEKEYESKVNDYSDIDVEEMEKSKKEKLSKLSVHRLLQQFSLIDLLWEFDCTSLYPSGKWDEESIYPKIEAGYAFQKI